MKTELLITKYKEVSGAIEKFDKKKAFIENVRSEERREVEKKYYDKIRFLENKKREEINKIRDLESSELDEIKIKKEPFEEIRKKIEEKFKLFDIKENLEDVETKYDGWCREEIKTLKEENLNLIKISSFLGRNKKEVNKFNLEVYVFYKNKKLDNLFNLGWKKMICEKSFKTKEEVKAYFERNYNKIVKEVKEQDLELFNKIKEIDIDFDNEFDFELIKPYSDHRWKLKDISKNKATFIQTYDREDSFEVEYLGGKKFKVSSIANQDELKYSLGNSIFNFIPEIICENG